MRLTDIFLCRIRSYQFGAAGAARAGARGAGHARGAGVPLGARPSRRALLRQVVQGRQGVLPPRAARPRAPEEVPSTRSRRGGIIYFMYLK